MLARSEFGKNVTALMSGTAIAQAIPILSSPFLARLYPPDKYGFYALYMSIAGLLAIVATGRFEMGIVLPADDRQANKLLTLALILSGLFSVIVLLVVMTWWFIIRDVADGISGQSLFFLIPLSVLFLSGNQCFSLYAVRFKLFPQLAKVKTCQSTISTGLQLVIGLCFSGAAGLLIGHITGLALAVILLAVATKHLWSKIENRLEELNFGEVARTYRKFPQYDVLNAMAYNFSNSALVWLLGYLYGGAVLGLYGFTLRLLVAPVTVFVNSFNQVFYQRLSVLWNSNKRYFRHEIKIRLKNITFVSLPLYIVFVFLIKYFSIDIFGNKWSAVSSYIIVLSPLIYINIIFAPYSNVLKIINRQNYSLILNLFLFLAKISSIFVISVNYKNNPLLAIHIMSVVSAIVAIINNYVICRLARVNLYFPPYISLIVVVGLSILMI